MKKILTVIFCINFLLPVYAQEPAEKNSFTILLTGASFATKENGWFEIACRNMEVTAINRALGGKAICDAANQMVAGELYTPEELEEIDALVIMHVHDREVCNSPGLKENYQEYATPFNRDDYAIPYDYMIKKYMVDCYSLKDNPSSRYYGSKAGKPVVIVLCTHWHDARTIYNTSIRCLAGKWGFPLVEFDNYVGFSRHQPHPVTKEQMSLLYAQDTQKTDDILYGWHPMRGEDKYIQKRMAAIFADVIKKIKPLSN